MTEPTTVPARRPPGPAPLLTTSAITTFGSLWWLGIVWAGALVVFGLILAIVSVAGGSFDDSLWQGVGAGWQRWVVLGAGWSMVPSFAPMLVTHGVTRRRLAQSAAIAGGVIAAACGLVVAIGYGIEDAVFARNDWDHVLDGGEAAGGLVFSARAWLEVAITVAGYFVTGWLLGAAVYHHGKDSLLFWILPCAVPAVLVELLMHTSTGNFGFGFLHDALDAAGEPSAWIGVPAALAVLAVSGALASRLTRGIDLRS